MQDKVLITYVKDGERTPTFVVVNIDSLSSFYASIRHQTTSPVTISPVVYQE